jgi:GT2 family glycosyltransferase
VMNPMTEEAMSISTPLSLPATSLIICTRNRPKLLAELVASILQAHEVPSELIIVDDSDIPHKNIARLTTCRRCDIRYMWTHSRGLSRANNTGIAAARHDLLVFTQDDVLVSPTWFGTIARALVQAGPRSIITGQVAPGKPETAGGFAPATKADEEPVIYERRTSADVLYVQNMAMYRCASDEVGHFDERLGPGAPFPASEDSDFALRLLEASYRIHYVPQAVVYHRAWRTAEDYLPLRWSYGMARGGFYAKHLSLYDRHILVRMVRDIRIHIVSSLVHLRRDRQRAYGDAALAVGILYGAVKWCLTQRKTP